MSPTILLGLIAGCLMLPPLAWLAASGGVCLSAAARPSAHGRQFASA